MRRRQVAKRVLISEIKGANEQVERDGIKYAVTPTGDLVNRVFMVVTVTEVEQVRDDLVRIRIADPSGGMFVWITDKRPEITQKVRELEVPALVAIKGKVRIVDDKFTTIWIEKMNPTDDETQKLWLKEVVDRIKKLTEGNSIDPKLLETIETIERYEL